MAGQFISRFTPVEVSMKAQAAIVTEDQVVGMVTPELVLIRKDKGNMFQSVLRARLAPYARPERLLQNLEFGLRDEEFAGERQEAAHEPAHRRVVEVLVTSV